MGIVAGVWGIEASFYVIGGLFLAATLTLGMVAKTVMDAP
jgi:hypothetical protein